MTARVNSLYFRLGHFGDKQTIFVFIVSQSVANHLVVRRMVVSLFNLRGARTAHFSNGDWVQTAIDALRDEVMAKAVWH